MKRFKELDFLFLLTALLVSVFYLSVANPTLDIAIHDTYLVICKEHVSIALSLPFLFFALIYFLFKKANKPLYKILGIVHYIMTISFFLAILIALFIHFHFYKSIAYRHYITEIEYSEKINIFYACAAIISIFGQFVLIINIIATLFRKREKNTP